MFTKEASLEPPPDIEPGSPTPMDWTDRIPRHRELWEKAEAQHYDPNTVVDWSALRASDFSDRERLAVAYWFATSSVFENSGVPTFAHGMVKAYEEHLGDSTSRVLLTIARDEANHDEMSRRIVETLLPGFPNRVLADVRRPGGGRQQPRMGPIHERPLLVWLQGGIRQAVRARRDGGVRCRGGGRLVGLRRHLAWPPAAKSPGSASRPSACSSAATGPTTPSAGPWPAPCGPT